MYFFNSIVLIEIDIKIRLLWKIDQLFVHCRGNTERGNKDGARSNGSRIKHRIAHQVFPLCTDDMHRWSPKILLKSLISQSSPWAHVARCPTGDRQLRRQHSSRSMALHSQTMSISCNSAIIALIRIMMIITIIDIIDIINIIDIISIINIIKGSLGGETSVLRTFRMSGKELVKERVSKERVSQRNS